jgi:hypothetical protein
MGERSQPVTQLRLPALGYGAALLAVLAAFSWHGAVAQDAKEESDTNTLYLSDFTWTSPTAMHGVKLYYIRDSDRSAIIEHDLSNNRQRQLGLQGAWEFLCLVRTEPRTKDAQEVSDFGVAGCSSSFDSVSIVGVVSRFSAVIADPYENDAGAGIVEMAKLLENGKNDHVQLRYRPYSTPLDRHFYDSQSVAPDATAAALAMFNELGPIIALCRSLDFHMGDLSKIGGVRVIRSYTSPLDVAAYHMEHAADDQRFRDSFRKILEIFLFDRNWKSSPTAAVPPLPCRRTIYLEDGKILIEADQRLILLDVWARTASVIAEDASEPIAVRVLN